MDSICKGPLPIADRLEIRRLVDGLSHSSEWTERPVPDFDKVDETGKALTLFKANLKRRTVSRDGLTSARLMELPNAAQAILLSSIAFIFRGEVDDWSQINFGNETHVEMLEASVTLSLAKLTNPQGRPINEALDIFFIGLRDLYEKKAGQPAIASAHFNNEPKNDFEKLMYLGYQIIRPAQAYPAALKAYDRAISRNS